MNQGNLLSPEIEETIRSLNLPSKGDEVLTTLSILNYFYQNPNAIVQACELATNLEIDEEESRSAVEALSKEGILISLITKEGGEEKTCYAFTQDNKVIMKVIKVVKYFSSQEGRSKISNWALSRKGWANKRGYYPFIIQLHHSLSKNPLTLCHFLFIVTSPSSLTPSLH